MSRGREYAVDVFRVLEMLIKQPLIVYMDKQYEEGADTCYKSENINKGKEAVP